MKTKLKRVQLQEQPQVVMPDDVLYKIKQLCNVMPTVEWSGILLYDVKGTIKNPTKMIITLRDIILMDKGQKAFTSYNFNEKKRDQSGYSDRHIDYCEENEKALTWKIGHKVLCPVLGN